MNARKADAAEKPQPHAHNKTVREYGECETGNRSEQGAAHVEPAHVHAICRSREKWNRDGVTGKIDTANPARLSGVERPVYGDLMQGRREGHKGREVRH